LDRTVKKALEQKEKEEAALAKLKEAFNNKPIIENEGFSVNKTSTTWYFYNTSSLSLGYSEFMKRYGRRTLEDNWRRSNKESYTALNMGSTEEATTGESDAEDGKESKDESAVLRKKFLANIPLTPLQLQNSDSKIAMGLYNVGQCYREDIVDHKSAIKYYENLLKRFPENKFKVESYFHLYRIYNAIPNKTAAENYKQKILTEFPHSLFAKVIADPKFVSDTEEKNKKAMLFYDSVYTYYLAANYELVMSKKPFVDSTYFNTSIGPRYAYLYALCKAKTNNIDAFEFALNDLIKNYPSAETANIARETLQKINQLKNPKLAVVKSNEPSPYSLESKGPFLVIISTDDKAILKETKIQTSKFNSFEFSLLNLSVNSELIGDNIQLVTISSFMEINKAKEYLISLNKQSSDVIKLSKGNYQLSVISEKNYKILQAKKDIKQYLQFYESNIENNE
jgi:tetratricopeptide (TPR) repeat protein